MTPQSRLRRAAWRGHDALRNTLWRHGDWVRRLRPPPSAPARARKVVHVTTSFDVGGTQKQIAHLVSSDGARYRHTAVELFPELNYVFRPDERIEPKRYVRGGPIARLIGRAIVDRNKRGSALVQVAKLVRDFEDERPSVAVGWGHEICVTTFLAAAIARVPHIVFCIRTANPSYGWADPEFGALLRDAHRKLSPHVARVVANSRFVLDDHAEWASLEPSSMALCHNGIAVARPPLSQSAAWRADVRARLGIPERAIVVSNIGRVSQEKGQRSMLDAAALLGVEDVVWLLAGDGPLLGELQELARARGLSNVVFAGRVARADELLATSEMFVMPSDFEGMPNAMMEAMAAGLPCISTLRSGIRDVAREGLEALFYEAGDAASLARHVRTLIDDRERRRALGAAAAARIAEFSVDRFVTRFETILDEVHAARVH